MKKIVEKTTWYQCSICKTKYLKASDAKKCEARILEERKFKVGDLVINLEPRFCGGPDIENLYRFKGKVVKIIGPMPSDYEYEVKWLKRPSGKPGRLISGHVWQYEIKYTCPRCKRTKKIRYYSPEIRKIN